MWTADCQIRSVQCQAVLTTSQKYLHKLLPRNTLYCNAGTKHVPVLLCTTKLARSTFQYDRVLHSLHKALPCRYFLLQSLPKALPSTTVYYKACTKNFPVLPCTTNPVLLCTTRLTKHVPILLCTTKLAGSHSRYYLLQSLQEVVPSTMYYKACRKSFPVLVCTTKLAQSTFQYYFVLQNLQKAPPSTTLCYNACLHKALPSTTVYYKACTKHFPVRPCTTNPVLLCTTKLAQNTFQYYFVLQSLQEVVPSTTLYYKACRKHVPLRLCTTKLAQSTSQYDFVLQSLHKARSSTTLYYKTCTKHFPVRLCATKLAQSTFQYYFVLQNLHKAPPSTTLCYNACLHKALPSTTAYYKACTKHFPVRLCTTKLAQSTFQYYFVLENLHTAHDATGKPSDLRRALGRSKTSMSCETCSNFDTFGTFSNRLECYKLPRLPRKTT